MSKNELQVLKKYLDGNLSKEFIRASLSPAAAHVLFIKNPEGSLQFCVSYCDFNAFTFKNKYPLLLIRETLDRHYNTIYFTKLDIVATFNKICMAAGEE